LKYSKLRLPGIWIATKNYLEDTVALDTQNECATLNIIILCAKEYDFQELLIY